MNVFTITFPVYKYVYMYCCFVLNDVTYQSDVKGTLVNTVIMKDRY